ncbi:MIEF1 upstream open reading frame protein isoform X1 [Leptopilina boulardi]|uniref:MIEF1 upstream open reading frame protein isoform X1 n=1 Tax=Leptopilina boulardi TaxID=63433 RepID=UPI0021F60144|nr:MIEF1 upstream open reading frame protein isoform X1 [Leptopilina boulardi]
MSREVLQLYKNLLRYRQNLKYTDKDYFTSRIKKIFRQNQCLGDEKIVKFQIQKGHAFLKNKRVV